MLDSFLAKKIANNIYVVCTYNKNKIENIKDFEDKLHFIVNIAQDLKKILRYKKYKKEKYYVVKINLKNYKIEFVDIKDYLKIKEIKHQFFFF